MASKKKEDLGMGLFGELTYAVATLIGEFIILVFKLIFFILNFLSFRKTQYKEKSGNGFFKTYFSKGNWGEYKLYKKLIKVFGEDKVLTNVYLPSQNTDTTEIDVLAVHDGIVYCYEVKNYSGYIYGKNSDKYWTQVLRYKTKNKFYNPIRQNYAHQKALENFLSLHPTEIITVIVFGDKANLEHLDLRMTNVLRLKSKFTITPIEGKNKDEDLIAKLKPCCNASKEIKEKHIEQINQLKA